MTRLEVRKHILDSRPVAFVYSWLYFLFCEPREVEDVLLVRAHLTLEDVGLVEEDVCLRMA